jgi:hypothetical protein
VSDVDNDEQRHIDKALLLGVVGQTHSTALVVTRPSNNASTTGAVLVDWVFQTGEGIIVIACCIMRETRRRLGTGQSFGYKRQ